MLFLCSISAHSELGVSSYSVLTIPALESFFSFQYFLGAAALPQIPLYHPWSQGQVLSFSKLHFPPPSQTLKWKFQLFLPQTPGPKLELHSLAWQCCWINQRKLFFLVFLINSDFLGAHLYTSNFCNTDWACLYPTWKINGKSTSCGCSIKTASKSTTCFVGEVISHWITSLLSCRVTDTLIYSSSTNSCSQIDQKFPWCDLKSLMSHPPLGQTPQQHLPEL